MKSRLAAALAHYPGLLILDETDRGVDPFERNEIIDFFWNIYRTN
jgi:ABC-type multidrug transport system ATPase subunit